MTRRDAWTVLYSSLCKGKLNLFTGRMCLKEGRGRKDASSGTWDAGTQTKSTDVVKNIFEKKKFNVHCFWMSIFFNLTVLGIH